tara:strand:+ start:969 stop:1454 length:486 start_codon:yes stop_codon:yes gene_type:complete
MKHHIIDNFIDPILFSSIRDTTTRDTFFWFYNDFVNYRPCKGFKFTNEIVKDSNLTHRVFISYLTMVKPVLDKINPKKLHSVRFNLFTQTLEPQKYLINHHKKNSKVAILFVNNTNGGIEIDNNFIKSTENQLVSFDSNTEYNIVTPTKNEIFTYLVVNYD